MKKLSFKTKFYIFLTLLLISTFFIDLFNLFELNRYSGLMLILVVFIFFCSVQYRAAKISLDTLLSITRDYEIRKLWHKEHQYDWEKMRENIITWAPICIAIHLIEVLVLFFTGNSYTMPLLILWAVTTFLYVIFTRPIKFKESKTQNLSKRY